jgi:hypothetical protein
LTRRLVPYLLTVLAACGGSPAPATPSPATPADALAGFLDAVRQNDLSRMGQLWGSERGPAAGWMAPEELNKRVAVMQKYLAHSGYRVVEGPMPVPGESRRMSFRVELRRDDCVHVQAMDVVRVDPGGWVVQDVHLGEARSPVQACPSGTGTPR